MKYLFKMMNFWYIFLIAAIILYACDVPYWWALVILSGVLGAVRWFISGIHII